METRPPLARRGAALQAAAALLWLPQAGLIAWALQRLADGGGVQAVLWPAAGLAALGVLRALMDTLGARWCFRGARAQLSTLRAAAVAALAARSPLDADRSASGLAASVMAEQAESLVPYLSRFEPTRLRVMVMPAAILLAVAPLSWVAALALLLAAPLIPLFMALIGWRAQAASQAQLVEMGGMNAFLLDRLRGLATIRSLGAVDLTARRLRQSADDLRSRTMKVLRIAFLSSAVLELFAALGVATVAVYVGLHLLGLLEFGAWRGRLSLGQGLFLLLLAPAFFEPLRDLSAVWHDRAAGQAALAALQRLGEGGLPLPGGAQVEQASRTTLPARRPPAVALRRVRFHHPAAPQAPVLHNADLQVAAGEHVALVGASGSGKTTLLSLIAGLAPANGGQVLIDGEPLAAHNAAALRGRMAWIGQTPHVFAGTVQANVALGRPGIGAAQVAQALRVAALDGVAQAHAGHALGEAGAGLSGGEALRLAIARAAADPQADLLLVDEPTAHLDAATAADVTERLLMLAQGKTLIVATHDPVLAARLDRSLALPLQPAAAHRSTA
ncbi:thiol reductant ABC exporter subunit CydD [Aquincola sp. J276]|uniref:thiol reductant ABC exporter subunit CydD n=1 Tax=Aquincola sp. J276 TaxID=2898432 RepID=UPI002151D282|nr:thiol reductant ABC exporter subunit CydD [Aquincola sp. J276]MCR5865262.1 thiol reductant ABC exporter subunit CydD [Aquincola sp. J276]